MRLRHLITVGLAAVALAGCVPNGAVKDTASLTQSSPFYTGKTESKPLAYRSYSDWLAELDDAQVAQFNDLTTDFIVDDREIVKPLYDVANRLLKGWKGTRPNMAIFVVASSEANTYNAMALQNDTILINFSVLESAESDDEIAAVLAHEISHILLRHNDKLNYFKTASEVIGVARNVAVLKETLEATSLERGASGHQIKVDPSVYSEILKADAIKRRVTSAYSSFHGTAFSRGSETEADLLAADLLVSAEYSPLGLRHSLERLSSSYETESLINTVMSGWAEDTAKIAEDNLQKVLTSYQQTGSLGAQDALIEDLKSQVTSRLMSSLEGAVMGFLANRHPVPEDRINTLAEVLDEQYSRKERNRRLTDSWLKRYRASEASTILASYDAAQSAYSYASLGRHQEANQELSRALRGKASSSPYVRYLSAYSRAFQNAPQKTLANYERIGEFTNAPTPVVTEVAYELASKGKLSAAERAIRSKEARFGDMQEFIPTKIQIALERKDKDAAVQIAQACVSDLKIKSDIRDQCGRFGLVAHTGAGVGGFLNGLNKLTNLGQ